MSFVSFVDPNQVFFDDEGNINAFGRISFCEIGTSALKHVFTDKTLTTSASNPQILNVQGRLDNQIFLGYGEYTIFCSKYIGTADPNTAPNEDFVLLYTRIANGLPASTAGSTSAAFQLDTIADLRALTDPAATPVVTVLSYNALGDLYPRTYTWDASSTESDNYGSIIKCTSVATGRYKMKLSNVIDVREFGIFSGLDSTKNSQLNSLISLVNSDTEVRTIYFPAGIYNFAGGVFSFNRKIILEDGARFSSPGQSLALNINSDYEIRYSSSGIVTKGGFANTPIDMEYVNVNFGNFNTSTNREIKASWYTLATNGDHTDAYAIQQFFAQPKIYTKVIDQNIDYASLTNITTSGDIVFDGGNIKNGNGTITFASGEISQRSTGAFDGSGTLDNYVFKDCTIDSRVLQNNGTTLDTFQSKGSTSGCIIEFRDDFTFSTNFTDNRRFRYKHIDGLIYANTVGQIVTFDALDRSDTYIFAGSSNVATKDRTVISNYLPTSATEAQESTAFRYALNNAFRGSGILDLQNRYLTVSAAAVITNVDGSGLNLGLKNGTLNIVGSIFAIDIDDSITQLTIDNVSVIGEPSSTQTFIKVESPRTVTLLNLKNITTSLTGAASTVITTENGGSIIACNISDSFITAGVAVSDAFGSITELSITNSEVTGDITHIGSGVHTNLSNVRQFKGLLGVNYLNGHEQTNINQCSFTGLQILIYPENSSSNYYASKISNCSFESTSANASVITYFNSLSDTKMIGTSVTNCSFVGNNTDSLKTISVLNDTGATYSSAYNHKILVSDNLCTVDSFYNTVTKGTFEGPSECIYAYPAGAEAGVAQFRLTLADVPDLLTVPNNTYNQPKVNYFMANSLIPINTTPTTQAKFYDFYCNSNTYVTSGTPTITFVMGNSVASINYTSGNDYDFRYNIELYK